MASLSLLSSVQRFTWLSAAIALCLLPAPLLASEGGAELASTTDPASQGIVGAVILALFVMLSVEMAHRVLVAMACAAFLWMVTYLTPWRLIGFEASARALDLNVLLLLAGMMTIVGILKQTGAFGWAVGRILARTKGHPLWAARLISWFTAVSSAFLDNVTTVIFVTPMAAGMAKRIGLAPVALLLPMVVASNIGGTATLIGDPPNMMIGSGVGLSFMAFVVNLTAPVLTMMVVLQFYLGWYYRDEYAAARSVEPPPPEEVELAEPALFRWMMVIFSGVLLGFVTHAVTGMPAAVPAVVGAAAALVVQDYLYLRTHRPTAQERAHGILEVLEKDIEWPTLSFFVFLFIVVGAAVETGLIASIANGMEGAIFWVRDTFGLGGTGTLIFAALLICWMSAVLSAFIDNIPYVAVSIPVIHQLGPSLGGGDRSALVGTLPGRLPGGQRHGGGRVGQCHLRRPGREGGRAHHLRRVRQVRRPHRRHHHRDVVALPRRLRVDGAPPHPLRDVAAGHPAPRRGLRLGW